LGLNTRALSQLTGPLWVAPTKDCGRFDRIDIGLNLKSGNKGLCVADYTRPQKEGNGWEFSQQAIKLLQAISEHSTLNTEPSTLNPKP
jgi:5'-3' exoribonuclease 1